MTSIIDVQKQPFQEPNYSSYKLVTMNQRCLQILITVNIKIAITASELVWQIS
uniref:Uncharacterized protein n=1 Tax=Rhizophora mucronata TaxID=61149 RepID=A0A2P2PW09_RHIMU